MVLLTDMQYFGVLEKDISIFIASLQTISEAVTCEKVINRIS